MDILEQVEIYEDSEELAQALGSQAAYMREEGRSDTYYLKECEVHILGLWDLTNELKEEVKKLRRIAGVE